MVCYFQFVEPPEHEEAYMIPENETTGNGSDFYRGPVSKVVVSFGDTAAKQFGPLWSLLAERIAAVGGSIEACVPCRCIMQGRGNGHGGKHKEKFLRQARMQLCM